jgi:hypothetical protein
VLTHKAGLALVAAVTIAFPRATWAIDRAVTRTSEHTFQDDEDLDPVVACIRHNNPVLAIHRHAAGATKLAGVTASIAKRSAGPLGVTHLDAVVEMIRHDYPA